MSRGPGRVERAIIQLFEHAPDDAYSVEDLIDRIYPALNRIEKKHRVAVIRAAKNACNRIDGWSWSWSENLGGSLVFWTRYDLASYALVRIKTDMFAHYRSNDTRVAKGWIMSPADALGQIQPGGKHYHLIVEGGTWWRHVELWKAERDGDASERTAKLKADQAATEAQIRQQGEMLRAALTRGRT